MRLILFVDLQLASSRTMLAGGLKTAAAREDVEVAAIFDTSVRPPNKLPAPHGPAGWTMRRTLQLATAAESVFRFLPSTAVAMLLRQKTKMLSTGDGTVNDPAFVVEVTRLAPDAALNLMSAQIFRPPLLAACNVPINYHNGLLPHYQGVAATSWSIYQQAPVSGFTFHRMTTAVDRGPILLQGGVRLGPGARLAPVERAKSQLASLRFGRLFDMLAAGVHDSTPPRDPGSYFSRPDLEAIRTIDDPEGLTLDELDLRMRAFESLDLKLAGRYLETTELRLVGRRPRSRELAFLTADRVCVEPSRVRHLPIIVYRPLRSGLVLARAAVSRRRKVSVEQEQQLTAIREETEPAALRPRITSGRGHPAASREPGSNDRVSPARSTTHVS